MYYPAPLQTGGKIAISAFSAGVPTACHDRLDIVLQSLRDRGFDVIEGENVRINVHAQVSAQTRADELMTFLTDDSVDAVFPPWGGELAMQILPLLDFEKLAHVKPKWIIGFSDVSTIMIAITTKLGWATVHTANLMQLHPKQEDALTSKVLAHLTLRESDAFTQCSSKKYELVAHSIATNPDATFNLTQQTVWKRLDKKDPRVAFSGRLIGGCFDTLAQLIGSEYFDIAVFAKQHREEGVILYLENAEMSPTVYLRALLSIKFKGFLSLINGLIIGRNAAVDSEKHPIMGQLSNDDALAQALYDVAIPIIYDADIGHLAPNLTLVNGAYATVVLNNGVGSITQTLK